MAAKNTDSHKIFEAYSKHNNAVINEALPLVAGAAALGARALPYAARALPAVGSKIAQAGRGVAQAARNFSKGVSNPRMTNLPSGQNAATKAGSWVARHPGTVAGAGMTAGMMIPQGGSDAASIPSGSTNIPGTSTTKASETGAGRFASGGSQMNTGTTATAAAETPQSSWNLTSAPDMSLDTVKPGEAVAAGTAEKTGLGQVAQTSSEAGDQATGSTSTQVAQGEPTAEEKELFKKLHGSEYAAGVGDQRLAELRQAVQQTGSTDVSKVAPAAYAQQYAGTPQGQAYAKRVEAMGVKVPKPGEVSPPPTNYAQQAADLGLSPETQQDLAAAQSQPAATEVAARSQSATPEGGMTPDQFVDMGRQMGLSQATLDALQKDLKKS